MSGPEPRWKLIQHLREQIERDPEAYANDAKLRAALRRARGDLTGAPDNPTVARSQEDPYGPRRPSP